MLCWPRRPVRRRSAGYRLAVHQADVVRPGGTGPDDGVPPECPCGRPDPLRALLDVPGGSTAGPTVDLLARNTTPRRQRSPVNRGNPGYEFSGKWQATWWPAEGPEEIWRRGGSWVLQMSWAFQQRVWKRQAGGGLMGLGTSPCRRMRSRLWRRRCRGRGRRRASRRCRGGAGGRRGRRGRRSRRSCRGTSRPPGPTRDVRRRGRARSSRRSGRARSGGPRAG